MHVAICDGTEIINTVLALSLSLSAVCCCDTVFLWSFEHFISPAQYWCSLGCSVSLIRFDVWYPVDFWRFIQSDHGHTFSPFFLPHKKTPSKYTFSRSPSEMPLSVSYSVNNRKIQSPTCSYPYCIPQVLAQDSGITHKNNSLLKHGNHARGSVSPWTEGGWKKIAHTHAFLLLRKPQFHICTHESDITSAVKDDLNLNNIPRA